MPVGHMILVNCTTYPSPLDADVMPAGAVAMPLPGAVPVSPSLTIRCPRAGGAVRGLRWLGGMFAIWM